MKLIKSPEEFKKFYPYKSPPLKKEQPPKKEYPKRYPCFAIIINHEDVYHGCMEWKEVKIIYPPKDCNLKSFELGLKAGIKFY